MGDRAAGYTSSPDVLDAAKNQMNYILGINPLRHSYVVGEGADSATTTFSGIYWACGVYTPPAGYMGGGPNWYNSPWFSRFPARAFAGGWLAPGPESRHNAAKSICLTNGTD